MNHWQLQMIDYSAIENHTKKWSYKIIITNQWENWYYHHAWLWAQDIYHHIAIMLDEGIHVRGIMPSRIMGAHICEALEAKN